MKSSKADRLAAMLKDGKVELVVNGVVLGTAKVITHSRFDLEIFPPIERVTMTVQFEDD